MSTTTMMKFLVCCSAVLLLFLFPAFSQDLYKILPASSVQISGTSTLSNWVVRSQSLSGEMTFSATSKTAKTAGTIKNAKAVLEVSSIKSEKGETMDNKMYGALKMESHPQITFALSQPIDIANVPAKLSATGNVTLAGVTRSMNFDVQFISAENGFHIQSKKSLKLSDFEIEPPTAMFGQIETGDEIVVELELRFGK